jgi:hypothetical protein
MRVDDKPIGGSTEPDCVRQVFRRDGEYWTIEYAGIVFRLRDAAGLRHLAYLLQRAGERVPATELIAPRTAAGQARDARDAERARVTVTRAIRAALRRLGQHHPALLEHFKATIRTGTACAYEPDARLSRRWEL